jgi:type IX secretion system PorP/SprF family membrane protein
MGLGLVIDRISAGLFSTTDISGNYAHRIEMGQGILALGLGFSASFYNILWNRIRAADKDDQLLLNGRESAILPDFSFGAYYYTDRFYAGFSVPRFLTHEYDKNSGSYRMKNDFSEYTFLTSAGLFAKLNEQMTLFPSAIFSYNPSHKPQLNINTSIILKDKIWIGAGYKSTNSVTGLLRCQVNYQLSVAYSYDLDLGSFGQYSNGTHEVVLGYVFRYLRNVNGPRYF